MRHSVSCYNSQYIVEVYCSLGNKINISSLSIIVAQRYVSWCCMIFKILIFFSFPQATDRENDPITYRIVSGDSQKVFNLSET